MTDGVKAVKKAQNDEKLAQLEEELKQTPEHLAEQSPDDNLASAESLEEESAPTEEQPESQEESQEVDEQPVEETAEEGQDVDDVAQLSERAQKRFRRLSRENQDLRKNYEQLQNVVNVLQSEGFSHQQAQDLAPAVDQGVTALEDETVLDYERRVAAKAVEIVDRRMQEKEREQQRANQQQQLKTDIEWLESNIPELNQDKKESYDPDLDNYILDEYDKLSKHDPSVSLREVAEGVMEMRQSAVKKAVKATSNKVVKQATEQAIAPETAEHVPVDVSGELKSAKTIEELDEILQKEGLQGR